MRPRQNSFTIAGQTNGWHGCDYNFISTNKFFSHFFFLLATNKTINSDSIVECEIHVYFIHNGNNTIRCCLVITCTSYPTSIRISF